MVKEKAKLGRQVSTFSSNVIYEGASPLLTAQMSLGTQLIATTRHGVQVLRSSEKRKKKLGVCMAA